MKRYLFFLGIACLLHTMLLLPFIDWINARVADVGGGSGASIRISIQGVPAPRAEGLRHSPLQQTSQPSQSYDRGQAKKTGEGSGTSQGPASGAGSSRHGSDQTLAQIRARIEAAKHYPLMARRRGLEGTTTVSFRIQSDGSIQALTITHSSGTDILDEAAVQTIQRAAPFPSYSEPIQIGIRFALHETTDM